MKVILPDQSERVFEGETAQDLAKSISKKLAKAAVAVGADGLMIEVHNDPAHAKCDGAQSLTPDAFDALMAQLKPELEFFGKTLN